jgi:hypothetical protein
MEIVSGGGGWGLKQGLLSLDPDTTLQRSADARYDFDSNDSGDNEHVRALGNIAKPGSWVQFLISHQLTPKNDIGNMEVNNATPDSAYINYLSFGCIPSTVDDMPHSSSSPSVPNDKKDFQPSVDGFDGHFGAMSEAGIFTRAIDNGVATSSKIDVPYSNFRWGMIGREEV